MKQCQTCGEEFDNKFGFCPVDGTPLDSAVAPAAVASGVADDSATYAEDSATYIATPPTPGEVSSNGHASSGDATSGNYAAGNGFAAADGHQNGAPAPRVNRGEYNLTILEETGLVRRLTTEMQAVARESELTWPEFKRDPVGFTKRSAAGYGQYAKKFFGQEYVAPALIAPLFLFLFVASAYLAITNIDKCRLYAMIGRECVVVQNENENLELIGMVPEDTEIPKEQPTPDKGNAGLNKGKGGGSKPEQEKPGGGGGGGRQEQAPASKGTVLAQLGPQILPPDPHPPTIKNPQLAVIPQIDVDPKLMPEYKGGPIGDPKSKSTEISSGPGTGGGMGDGEG
ncbi:MAG: hypothetical protein WCD76_18380, partial [Pyrinomonadaceae bacterium]